MTSTRWLLLLGSNQDSDATLRQALVALAALGVVACRDIQHLPPRSGVGPWYFNALAQLDCALPESVLKAALREIESAQGRDRGTPEQVAIDIDVLAMMGPDGAWRADARALAKKEFDRDPAKALLNSAAIQVIGGVGKQELPCRS